MQDSAGTERVRQLGPLALSLALAGVALNFAGVAFNRNIFSLSFVLTSAGMAVFTLMLLGLIVDVAGAERYAAPHRGIVHAFCGCWWNCFIGDVENVIPSLSFSVRVPFIPPL